MVVWAHGVSSLAPSPKAGPPVGQYYSARPWPVQADAHGGGSVPPCDNCGAAESPQWRKGPPHAPRLCNACGARYLRTRSLEPAGGGGAGGVARRTSVSMRRVSETLVTAAAVAAHAAAALKAEGDVAPAARAVEASPLVQRGAQGVPFSPGGAANVLLMLLSAGSTGEEGDAAQAAAMPSQAAAAPVDGETAAGEQQGTAPPRRRSSQNVTASMQRAQPGGVDGVAPPVASTKGAKRKLEGLHQGLSKKTGDTPDGVPVAVGDADGGANTPMPTSAAASRGGGKRRRAAQGFVRSVSASASDDEPHTAAAAAAGPADAAAGQAGGAPGGALIPRMKTHRPWTLAEVRALVDGVSFHGRGQWADIKASAGEVLGTRSSVDVKDKWRNLLRISSLPTGTEPRRSGDSLPQELLHRVRALSAPMPANGAEAQAAAAVVPPPVQLAPPVLCAPAAVIAAPVPPPLEAAATTVPEGADGECGGAGPATAAVHRGGGSSLTRSKHHSPWSLEESTALVEGVAAAQGCKWTAIKAMAIPGLASRTAIDLKDRWRNLLALPSSSRRKQDVPQELLARVLQLESTYGVTRRKGRQ